MSERFQNFYVTFGQKYRRESHPKLGIINVDKVMQISAPSYDLADQLAHEITASLFSRVLTEEEYNRVKQHYPDGVMSL